MTSNVLCLCACSRTLGSEQGGTNGTTGPVIRTMKSSRQGTGEVPDYQDAIALMDCTPFWRRLGIRWILCQRMWFVKDVCGVICALFTWGLLLYAEFVITFVMLLPSPDTLHSLVNGIMFHVLIFLAVASHLRTMLTDPVSNPRASMRLSSYFFIKCFQILWIVPEPEAYFSNLP